MEVHRDSSYSISVSTEFLDSYDKITGIHLKQSQARILCVSGCGCIRIWSDLFHIGNGRRIKAGFRAVPHCIRQPLQRGHPDQCLSAFLFQVTGRHMVPAKSDQSCPCNSADFKNKEVTA